jgi:hypothetical protein
MSLGLNLGRNSAEGDNRVAYRAAQQVFDGFRKELGSVVCRELTGIDLRSPDGIKQLRSSGVSERVCLRAGSVAARLAQQTLAEAEARPKPTTS